MKVSLTTVQPAEQDERAEKQPLAEQDERAEQQPHESLELEALWTFTLRDDSVYHTIRDLVSEGARRIPPELKIKASLAECDIAEGLLRYRERLWVPNSEPLRTRLI